MMNANVIILFEIRMQDRSETVKKWLNNHLEYENWIFIHSNVNVKFELISKL